MKITTDAKKSITKTPVIELVDGPYTTSKEDAPYKNMAIDNSSTLYK